MIKVVKLMHIKR